MHWFLYNYNMNSNKIETFDLFEHGEFSKAVQALLEQKLPRRELASRVKSELMYYFCGKCEYEIVLTTNMPYVSPEELDHALAKRAECLERHSRVPAIYDVCLSVEKKIDVFDQVMLNWDAFIDYTCRVGNQT